MPNFHWKELDYNYNSYATQSENDCHFLYKWISQFIAFVQICGSNLSTINYHLFVLNGHNLHVTINVVHKTRYLYMRCMWLFFHHTCHVLQPLDVAFFKLFKMTLKIYKIMQATLINKGIFFGKKDLAQWVFLTLRKTLNPHNIFKGFNTIKI